MNVEKINAWLSLGASLGILAGLILVAVQIQQATDVARAEFLSVGFEAAMKSNELIVGENLSNAWIKAMTNSDQITDEEILIISAYLSREWLHNTRIVMITKRGYTGLPETHDATVRKWVFQLLGNETAIRWWRNRQEFVDPIVPEFKSAITKLLDAQGEEHHLYHANTIGGFRSTPLYP
jgi:hypothetical protein